MPQLNSPEDASRHRQVFDDCNRDGTPYTITSLALALDMTRQSLLEYEGPDLCLEVIQQAIARVKRYTRDRLSRDSQHPRISSC